ncbi:MAG: methyltransferase family protein [Caulobacteraceae bacterium]
MTGLTVTLACWDAWALSWVVAALWARRVASRPPLAESLVYLVPMSLGALLLFFGSSKLSPLYGGAPLWTLPGWASWIATLAAVAGLAFTWWARITLGDLWSGAVTRKEDHVIIRAGPYRLVRHPIYSGLILAAVALAIDVGQLANLIGAAILILGVFLKARLEERFLSQELGEQAYAGYKRTTPMLVPFWPAGR